MEKNKFNIKAFLIFTLFFILFTVFFIFTFYDYQAIKFLYIGDNILSTIFEFLGKIPAYTLLFIASLILSKVVNIDYSSEATALKWLYIFIMLLSSFLFYLSIMENLTSNILIILGGSLLFSIFITLFFIQIIKKFDRKKFIKYEKWAFLVVLTIISVLIITTGLKLFIGRIRYKDIINTPDYVFNYWYNFSFFGTGNSFPSGHVALGTTLILLPRLFLSLKISKKITIPIYILSIIFIVLNYFSRIFAGYHYITDVTLSYIITMGCYFIFDYILYKNKKINFDNSTSFQQHLLLGY